MAFLRKHWFDVGAVFALILLIPLFTIFGTDVANIRYILWLSLVSLFLHQFEEYRYPGYFPGMMNIVMFNSKQPDRFPLNEQTSFVVNVVMGWTSYALAAIFSEQAIWLGIGTILVSIGNFVAHTIIFNFKAKEKTIYNPGLITSWIFFLPLSLWFFYLIIHQHIATPIDFIGGLVLGGLLNYVGIIKTIEWMADENTSYVFPERCLPPR
jgi:hypothetical protein